MDSESGETARMVRNSATGMKAIVKRMPVRARCVSAFPGATVTSTERTLSDSLGDSYY